MSKKFIVGFVAIFLLMVISTAYLVSTASDAANKYQNALKKDYESCLKQVKGELTIGDMASCKELASGITPLFSDK